MLLHRFVVAESKPLERAKSETVDPSMAKEAEALSKCIANPNSQIVLKTDVYNYDEMHNKLLIALQSGVGAPDILVYHARSYKEINGDPLYDPNRHTRAQVLKWNPDGTPDFGIPLPDGKSD